MTEPAWEERRYRVVTVRLVSPVIAEVWLHPQQEPLAYRAGQYVLLCDIDYQLPPRSYSLARAPRPDGWVSLLVTRVAGGVTSSWVHDRLRPGDEVVLAGPYGTFTSDPTRRGPVLLVAAGSGLAPARALVDQLVPTRPVTLFYSARTAGDAIDRDRFERWAQAEQGLRYLLTLTRDPGAPLHQRIPDLLPTVLPDLRRWEVYASGPPGFVTGCAATAHALGAVGEDVNTEPFFTDPQPWLGPPAAKVASGQ